MEWLSIPKTNGENSANVFDIVTRHGTFTGFMFKNLSIKEYVEHLRVQEQSSSIESEWSHRFMQFETMRPPEGASYDA